MFVGRTPFGTMNGQSIDEYTLENDHGIKINCLNYGCVITQIMTPDKDGHIENIVLGFDNLDDYRYHSPYFGAVVGRVAGRLKDGACELNGAHHALSQNEGTTHLHGGHEGFSHKVWHAEPFEEKDEVGIVFTYVSPAGSEGYPGTLQMQVTYRLNQENDFSITYDGDTDETTLVNMTNHSYFNLSGHLRRDVTQHSLQLSSDYFLELDEESLPTGHYIDATDTTFDFRKGRLLHEGITSHHPQNELVHHGYDHPFVLSDNEAPMLLTDADSKRQLSVTTTEPCVVVYTGHHLPKGLRLQHDIMSDSYLGVCLETQKPPDALQHDAFPSIVLSENDHYHAKTTYSFSVKA